ncbi:MAG TPA: nucleotidyltransferase domain-containing protein [Microvirga sp.]|jgi:predicted nucleotidyltransferase|nr:nucleotidyltransferase domain-containing protein [Microvirga sp.]
MTPEELITAVTDALRGEERFRALLLGGSYGRGTQDRFSDVDLIAVADPEHHANLARLWRETLERLMPVVFWNERRTRGVLLNAIGQDWLRCDLVITDTGGLDGRARSALRVLIDRDSLVERLPPELPDGALDRSRITFLINEFIRVLGLTPVVLGRGEVFTAAGTGAGLLRDQLVSLLKEERQLADPGGALHLSRALSPDQMRVLEAVPFPQPEPASIIAAHLAVARLFLPRAKALAARAGVPWPQAFEEATRAHLERELKVEVTW